MASNASSSFLLSAVICWATMLVGCTKHASVPVEQPLTLDGVTHYFDNCPIGRPVQVIEKDLALPEPSETEAPASDWPHWKYKYFAGDLVIFFHAEDEMRGGESVFLYIRAAKVMTATDYWRNIADKQRSGARDHGVVSESQPAR